MFGAVTEATSAHQASWNQITNTADGPPLPEASRSTPLPAAAAPALTLELLPVGGNFPRRPSRWRWTPTISPSTTRPRSAPRPAGPGPARPIFDALEVRAPFAADSPQLFAALVRGGHYDQAVLTQTQRCRPGRSRSGSWRPCSSPANTIAGDATTGLPEESLKFVFAAVTEATSGHQASWNQVTNIADGPRLPDTTLDAPARRGGAGADARVAAGRGPDLPPGRDRGAGFLRFLLPQRDHDRLRDRRGRGRQGQLRRARGPRFPSPPTRRNCSRPWSAAATTTRRC